MHSSVGIPHHFHKEFNRVEERFNQNKYSLNLNIKLSFNQIVVRIVSRKLGDYVGVCWIVLV